MRLHLPAVAAVVALTIAACTGGTDSDDEPEQHSGSGGSATQDEEPTTLAPVIERVPAGEDSVLVAGQGEQQYQITGAASNGSDVLAVGSHVGEDPSNRRPAWFSSTDGRAWQVAGESLGESTWLEDVVAVDDELIAVGNAERFDEPTAWPYADGKLGQPAPVTFPDGEGSAIVESAATVDSRLYVLGLRLDAPGEPGQIDPDDPPTVSVVLTSSEDHGETWTPVEMPEVLAPIESNNALLETLAGGGTGADVTLTGHDGRAVLTVEVPGVDGAAIWGYDGSEWTELGNTSEVFGGERLDLLHSHGDSLVAFTRADDDASAWTSTDGGMSFERMELGSHVFGGGGSQHVDAALSLGDGTLLVAGRSAGEWNGLQASTEAEVWMTRDLRDWKRAIDDAGLASTGEVHPSALVPLGEHVVMVGTHERTATPDEIEARNAEAEDGQAPPPHPLARDAAAWVVSFEEQPVVEPPAEAVQLEVTGFEGDATVSDVISYDGGLVAGGYITEQGEGAPSYTAALWTTTDGESWQRVKAPDVTKPTGQQIHALATTGDGLVAVGRASDGDAYYLGSWTSPDGAEWTRTDTVGPDYESAVAYGLASTDSGLVAVGTSDSGQEDRYRSTGIWRSTDGGDSWSAVDTSGAPFRQRNAEVLSDVERAPDGTLVAVGHAADAEDREGGGFSYTPQAFVVESADGETWTAGDNPFPDAEWSDPLRTVGVDGGVVIVGTSGRPAADLPGEPTLHSSGVARRQGDGWSLAGGSYRHTARAEDAVQAPFGLVVVGHWSRRDAGSDVLVGVVGEDGVTFVDDGLVGAGDQEALAAVAFDDRVLVLGTETVDDETVFVGWSVAG